MTQPTREPFEPPRLFGSAHLQTVLASVAIREPWIRHRERGLRRGDRGIVLPAGVDIRLAGQLATHDREADPKRPLAVLIHGWLGGHCSRYLRSCAAHLFDAGFNVFRLNLRDHGGSEHLNRELFHSCRIDEVVAALQSLQALVPASARVLAGFSLGGNFALRVAARAESAGLDFARIVAVCPVLDPATTLAALDGGTPVYRHYFMNRWRSGLDLKRSLFPDRYADMHLQRGLGLGALTEYLVCRYAGFPDLNTYLRGYAVVDDALASITVPTTLIATADDPVNPSHDLTRLARPSALHIERLDRGGHCGLIDAIGQPSWADRRILDLFRPTLPFGR